MNNATITGRFTVEIHDFATKYKQCLCFRYGDYSHEVIIISTHESEEEAKAAIWELMVPISNKSFNNL